MNSYESAVTSPRPWPCRVLLLSLPCLPFCALRFAAPATDSVDMAGGVMLRGSGKEQVWPNGAALLCSSCGLVLLAGRQFQPLTAVQGP